MKHVQSGLPNPVNKKKVEQALLVGFSLDKDGAGSFV